MAKRIIAMQAIVPIKLPQKGELSEIASAKYKRNKGSKPEILNANLYFFCVSIIKFPHC